MRKLGLAKADTEKVVWTQDLIARGLAIFAGCAGESPERFREEVRVWVEEAEELTRKVRRLEAEAAAIVQLLDGGETRNQVVNLLPKEGRDERIAKYERHLHSLLTSTIHELNDFKPDERAGRLHHRSSLT
jgi:hypothetical protein